MVCLRIKRPPWLQAHYRDYGKMTYARSVFIIHNMAHQGRGPFDEVQNLELNETYKEMFRCVWYAAGKWAGLRVGGWARTERCGEARKCV
jgi:glycogen synthase